MSEVLAGLSYALDLTEGQRPGHSVRSCLIGMRLAEAIGLPVADRSALFYALLMKDLGCSSNAARFAALFGASNELPEGDLPFDLPEVTAEVQQQLNTPSSQLALYARDLKRIVDAERQKAKELAEANARLHILDQLKTELQGLFASMPQTTQQAVEAPNMNSYQMRTSFGTHGARPGRMLLAESIPAWIRADLRRMGYTLEFEERTSGPINAIFFDRKNGTMWGGSSHHGEDYGIAW